MGGKKKLSLKQIEKAQARQDSQSKGKTSGAGGSSSRTEKKSPGIVPPNPRDEKVMKELQKMKVLTPYTLASRFDLRLSAAKDFLEELHRRGIVTYVSGGRNIKIYKPLG